MSRTGVEFIAEVEGLATAAPLPANLERGLNVFRTLLARCGSFDELGRALAWVLCNFDRLAEERSVSTTLRCMILGKVGATDAMHRGFTPRSRPLFPLPLGCVSQVRTVATMVALDDFCKPHFAGLDTPMVWAAVVALGLNGLVGFARAPAQGKMTKAQERALGNIVGTVTRALPLDTRLERSADEAEKELSSRYLSYSGEEVPKMQVLKVRAAAAALPPISHGGSIDARELVCEGTRWFLEHPEESANPKVDPGIKLQAKVHIQADEAFEFCKQLVSRRICTWVSEHDVWLVNQQKVLNGMFGVGKGTYLDTGEEIQRTIMNLIPTNACFSQAQGATSDLPAITQYMSLVLNHDESLRLYQSDMSAAFYLFAIPPCWYSKMCFNISFPGQVLGLADGVRFYLACSVIPMGWSSAVSIMQEMAARLCTLAKLPLSHRVRRTAPLPSWLCGVMETARQLGKAWYHVYLDNFCAMERYVEECEQPEGKTFHEALEDSWARAGVLASHKKRVSMAPSAQELGALVDGRAGLIGPSGDRLLKLVQTTLVVLSKSKLRHKWVQVVAGRWVHCMSFRRPSMVLLDKVWDFVSGKASGPAVEAKVRSELFGCCTLGLMMHTNLRASLSGVTTASDASMSGGAVGVSTQLTLEGREFVAADVRGQTGGKPAPLLVLSLFNGIGCTFRCYDLCGLAPMVGISYELSAAGNRVTSRRWPYVIIEKDVRSLTIQEIRQWRYKYPEIEEIHIWGGFPCVGLSSVRAGRLNLDDPQSGLFWEMVRIIKEVRQVFGYSFRVRFAAENVASMDADAEAEITRALGVKPLKLDPAGVVPIHRPRYCWTNTELVPMEGVELVEKERWIEVVIQREYPPLESWLESGAIWPGYSQGAILPTCMKSIKRARPPPSPAGLNRAGQDAVMRWEADQYRFPPYQYGDKFIVWVNDRWRLANADERELLHGLGFQHTSLAWSASDIKKDPQLYEDVRKSLVGDSFSCFSFAYIAAMLGNRWIHVPSYETLFLRMGMAPGFCCPLEVQIPLARRLCYGANSLDVGITELHGCLLRRVNHTGSDVRIATGLVLNPRAFPRQSSVASWWQWSKLFSYRWGRKEHINALEFRAIIHALEWRVRHLHECAIRVFHFSDSYIAMSIISKGRTSSKMLQPLLRRLAALLMAHDIYLVITHVESTENPTDADSRS